MTGGGHYLVLQKWDARAPLLTLNHLVVRAHPA
eukprot:CAMPEP_0113248218 /NCGR_PEP_ID=MMETSP0008_2-20120614/10402_1 /TAXON_ID=97485 /ORGANISM="Prymnesium parvum" /LENGTH=32 /DNA_ID=CAMNT_0000096057 /DNA_START=162 /DNA_END=257 /DNA_ORIENTATION=+ /assembly_acc=CAM_ASM_000153